MLQNVSVFGSCRVHTPCSILARTGEIRMTQRNIFGFTHYAKEILQQFELVCGARQAPSRLQPYLNIPPAWKAPPAADFSQFNAMFADTDLFVIEISSIRELMFKALFLQINRVNELVVGDDKQKQEWWKNLLRRGRNSLDLYPIELAGPVEAEVVQLLKFSEQTSRQLEADVEKIVRRAAKPILFVSHFDLNYQLKPVPQRTIIAEVLQKFDRGGTTALFNPTETVADAGLEKAIIDLGHYKPEFEPVIAERLGAKIRNLTEQVREAGSQSQMAS
jgi:hypothetical protein